MDNIIHYPLSIIHYSLSIIHYSLSIIHYPLFIIHYPLSIIHYPLGAFLKFQNDAFIAARFDFCCQIRCFFFRNKITCGDAEQFFIRQNG
jgi:hypothetical protein